MVSCTNIYRAMTFWILHSLVLGLGTPNCFISCLTVNTMPVMIVKTNLCKVEAGMYPPTGNCIAVYLDGVVALFHGLCLRAVDTFSRCLK